nr:hypothetical protein [Tanacetum cinerariifolium]
MRTRSSSNLHVESPPNPSTSNSKCHNRRRSKQPFILEESPIDTMVDERTMVELPRAPTEGYAEAIVVPRFLLSINQQTSVVTTTMTAILKQIQATSPPASVKAVEENCFTCGGAHLYCQCLAFDGNTFPELMDNIQGYVAAAAVNYNQGSGSLPSNIIANLKGKLKSITTRSGIVLDGHYVPIPPLFINPEEDKCVEETLTDQDLTEYTIKVPPPLVQKSKPPSQRNFVMHQMDPLHLNIHYPSWMLKQKQQEKDEEKLQELENTPLNENCSTIILKKLPKKLRDPGKFLIPCARIARDVFVPISKFTFPADFVIVDYESDPRVPLILGRYFLQTDRALIDVHREEMILRDGDERLTLNMRHDTSSYSNQPQKESINLINVFNDSNLDSTKDLHPPNHVNPLSGSTTSSSSPNQLLEEFVDELALITFPPRNNDLQFDIESNLKEIKYLLHHDPIKDIDSILKDSMDQSNLANLNDNLVDSMPEMFAKEHALDYSSPPLYDEYDDDLFEVEPNTENVYDDPFDSKGEKIKESKLLIDEPDLPCDFLLPLSMTRFSLRIFFELDALSLTNNEDKIFKLGILIQENLCVFITHVAPEKNEKKLAISHASLMLEDFDPPLYELPLFKEVPRSMIILSFSSENEEKVFKPGIHTSKKVRYSFIPELSHQGYKVFKINQILKRLMKNFLLSCGKDIHILDVPCLYFYSP